MLGEVQEVADSICHCHVNMKKFDTTLCCGDHPGHVQLNRTRYSVTAATLHYQNQVLIVLLTTTVRMHNRKFNC